MNFEDITPENLPLDFVKSYLRIDHSFDDVEIMLMIASAKSYVKNYIQQPDDQPLIDIEVIIPMLTLVAYFYENKTVTMKSNEKLDAIFGSILSLHRKGIV